MMNFWLWIAWLVGYVMGIVVSNLRRKDAKMKNEAPEPDYDTNNPINGRYAEVVEICGHRFWRMN